MAISPEQLPSGASEIARAYPEVWAAYAALGKACAEAGPLDRRTVRLVKLALAIGALSEGAVHSHTRRALGTASRRRSSSTWPFWRSRPWAFPKPPRG